MHAQYQSKNSILQDTTIIKADNFELWCMSGLLLSVHLNIYRFAERACNAIMLLHVQYPYMSSLCMLQYGVTALMMAAQDGRVEVVKLLTAAGADCSIYKNQVSIDADL